MFHVKMADTQLQVEKGSGQIISIHDDKEKAQKEKERIQKANPHVVVYLKVVGIAKKEVNSVEKQRSNFG